MLARRLSVEEIKPLLRRPPDPPPIPKSPPVSRPSEAARACVSVESMAGAEEDADEIAAFLDAFFQRQGGQGSEPGAEPGTAADRAGIPRVRGTQAIRPAG